MTKAEIVTRIIDRITDPWSESPEDYRFAQPIDLDAATEYLALYREDDKDLDPEDRMPEEATPSLLMETYNCYIHFQKHKLMKGVTC